MSRFVLLVHVFIGSMAVVLSALALAESLGSTRLASHRRFGLALSALGVTCAAHYVTGGLGGSGAASDAQAPQLVAALMAMVPVAVFFWLRVEAYFDGPGDRFFHGRPGWISLLPSVAACTAGAVLVTAWTRPPAVSAADSLAARWLGVLPSTLLVATFIGIGWSLMRGQQTRQSLVGGWSLSGLAVTLVFPTMAVAYATQFLTELPTAASSIVDWVGVPAALWFWRECRRLTGQAEAASGHTVTVPAQRSKRPAPWAASDPG